MIKAFLAFLLLFFTACSKDNSIENEVTIYVSEDQVFSEPILKDFEKDTGIKIKAVYDSEESKGTGVMNRLIAEKNNPQADVYWANEPIRAEVLRKKGILAPYKSPNSKDIADAFKQKENYWCGFSARVRLFVVNKNAKEKPNSILDYANPIFKDKSVIANPLFGTTAIHIAALFTSLGEEKTKKFLDNLKTNKVAISTGNGESADFVASVKYLFSLVDSDDAISRIRAKSPIEFIYPDQGDSQMGAFVVPNTVMMIKDSKHPKLAKKLIDYLLSRQSEEKLAFADCAQIPLHKGMKMPKELLSLEKVKVMQIDFEKVADKLTEIQPYIKVWLDK